MPQSADDKLLLERLERDFTYHPPTNAQAEYYTHIRMLAKDLALYVGKTCPDGREKSLAITKLEEAVMWSNASIARGGGS